MPLPTNPNKPWQDATEDISDTPWVIVNTSTPKPFFECQRCKAREDPTFPVDMKVFINSINTFVNAHKECNEETEQECETCGGEGSVEGGNVCGNTRLGGCSDGMCGGCFSSEQCTDCPAAEEMEPDWDAMRESREEDRELRNEAMDEVEWESPE